MARSLTYGFIVFFLIALITSCLRDDEFYVKRTDLIHITEYSIPDSATVADTVQITATAQENNGCWRDLDFSFQQVGDSVYALSAYGTYESYGTCPQVIVSIDTVINFTPTQRGTYIFHVARDSYIAEVDTMFVKETTEKKEN